MINPKALGMMAIFAASILVTGALIATPSYASKDHKDNSKFNPVPTAKITTDNKRYSIGADYIVIEGDEGIDLFHDKDAKGAKDIIVKEGEDMSISFKCNGGKDCKNIDKFFVYLVDKDKSDKKIASVFDEDRINLAGGRCDDTEKCNTEFTIPDDIDSGKYKLVIDAQENPEVDFFYINKASVK
jgi:hypothetical protein